MSQKDKDEKAEPNPKAQQPQVQAEIEQPHQEHKNPNEIHSKEEKDNIVEGQSEGIEGSKKQSPQDDEYQVSKQISDNEDSAVKKSQSGLESPKYSYNTEIRQLANAGPVGRKCFNILCPIKKIYRKIRSKVEAGKYRFLCKSCYDNYVNNYYCQFCEQIYSNQNQQHDDMYKWIGCDSCQRWNHIECEKKYRGLNTENKNDFRYDCLICSDKNKGKGAASESKYKFRSQREGDESRKGKQRLQINLDQRYQVFHKKNETFPNLQGLLQNYNYRLWINESLIRQDIESIRNLPKRSQQCRTKNKKIKVD